MDSEVSVPLGLLGASEGTLGFLGIPRGGSQGFADVPRSSQGLLMAPRGFWGHHQDQMAYELVLAMASALDPE